MKRFISKEDDDLIHILRLIKNMVDEFSVEDAMAKLTHTETGHAEVSLENTAELETALEKFLKSSKYYNWKIFYPNESNITNQFLLKIKALIDNLTIQRGLNKINHGENKYPEELNKIMTEMEKSLEILISSDDYYDWRLNYPHIKTKAKYEEQKDDETSGHEDAKDDLSNYDDEAFGDYYEDKGDSNA